MRSARRRGRATLLCLGVAGLAACSTSGPAEQTVAPSVTDNGKRYSYAAGTVPQSRWPNPCTLLTVTSAAIAVGTPVTTKRFHANCFFIPASNDFPNLTVTILGIGSGLGGDYADVRERNTRHKPVKVPGVGVRAVTYTLPGSPSTTRLDLLAGQGLFEISLRAPRGSSLQQTSAASAVTEVGTALAREFRG